MDGELNRPEIPDALWSQFTPRIKAGIVNEFLRLEKQGDEKDPSVDWMRAFLQYLGIVERAQHTRNSWWRENVTGLMMTATLIALAFGILGAFGFASANPAAKDATASFLDIAKLFAGAVVGAAGATAIAKK